MNYQMITRPRLLKWFASLFCITVPSLYMDAKKTYLIGADVVIVVGKQSMKLMWISQLIGLYIDVGIMMIRELYHIICR